jgi:hypothetical protein
LTDDRYGGRPAEQESFERVSDVSGRCSWLAIRRNARSTYSSLRAGKRLRSYAMIFAAEGDASSTMISCPDVSGLRFSIHAVSEVSA